MPETSETSPKQPAITQKRHYRRFKPADITAVAKLMAQGNTEAEACRLEGINPFSFAHYRQRANANAKFNAEFEHARGELVNEFIQTMIDAGRMVNPKTGIPEWRAHQAAAQMLAPERFDKGHNGPAVNVQVGIFANSDLDALGAKVYSQPRQVQGKDQKQLQDKPLPKE